MKSAEEVKLSFKEKLSFGVGDIANSLAVASVSIWFLKFLTDSVGISPGTAGLAVMIGRIWDAIIDPVVGSLSDRTNSRWGKRRPYLLYGALAYGVSFFAIWLVPDFQTETTKIAYVIISLLIFNTCLAFVFIPYTSLTAAITNSYNERTSLTGYRMTLSQFAYLLGALIPPYLAQKVSEPGTIAFLESIGVQSMFGTWAGTIRQAYFFFAALFGLMMIASILVTFLGTRERFLEDDKDVVHEMNPFKYSLKIVSNFRTNFPFRISLLIKTLSTCAMTVITVNLPFYLEYVMGMKNDHTILTLLLFSGLITAPLWVFLARKYGKAEVYQVAALLYILVLPSLIFVSAEHYNYLYIICFFAGAMQSGTLIIPWAIIPDIVEYDEEQSGERREGLLYGGTSFAYKFATGLAVFISGKALENLGYVANAPVQSDTVLMGLRITISVVPMLFFFLSIIAARKYPLNAVEHKKLLERLAAKKLLK